MKNQLFKKLPSREFIIEILKLYGLNDVSDDRSFTRNDLQKLDTVNKLIEYKTELYKYYLPCKGRLYLNELNEKNIITILRQLLKTLNYTLNSREKYIKGSKFIIYNIISIKDKEYKPIKCSSINNEKTLINFD
tara:strand:+ start:444 stop:845 length:402 start_codon:yes stop_codon:yes gene_type:complete